MNKQTYIVIAVIVVLVVGGVLFFIFPNRGTEVPSSQAPQAATNDLVGASTTQTPAPPTAAIPSTATTTTSTEYVVTYTDSGFSPATLTVPQGSTVIFKNSASDAVWVASNPHPIHNGYPTTGGCISSTFDACKGIPPGGSWSFTFDIQGSWGYHNHLNHSEGGKVVVQ